MFVLLAQLARLPRPPRAGRGGRGALQIRHVDAGSCNGCEHELQATLNPFHDMARFGFAITASPRHADVLLVTGSVTTPMLGPLRSAYDAMSEPRTVAALGDCALGRSLLCGTEGAGTRVEDVLPVALRIPGCPPDPETIARHLLEHRAGRTA